MATNTLRTHKCVWRATGPLARPSPTPDLLGAAMTWARMALGAVRHEALKDGVYMVPVRVFIGIGWLRAFVEKVLDHGWRTEALADRCEQ